MIPPTTRRAQLRMEDLESDRLPLVGDRIFSVMFGTILLLDAPLGPYRVKSFRGFEIDKFTLCGLMESDGTIHQFHVTGPIQWVEEA